MSAAPLLSLALGYRRPSWGDEMSFHTGVCNAGSEAPVYS